MGLFSGGLGTSTSTQTSDSYSGLDKKALPDWNNLFSGYQQGIAPWQQAGFGQAMDTALSKFSGLNAARGGMTPFSLPQIASSAAQYTVPQFTLANSDAMNNLLAMRNINTNHSVYTGTSRNAGANMFGSALAGALGNAMSPSTYLGSGGGGSTAPAGAKAMFV